MASTLPITAPRIQLAAGVIAAMCWSVADMLLVGFVQRNEDYPLLSVTLANALGNNGVDFAVLMQEGSPTRLFWGVLLATFSVVGYLAAALGIRRILPHSWVSSVSFGLLFFGYALSPLGHAGFYYLGISSQTLLKANPADHQLLVEQFSRFYEMLFTHWIVSVASSAIGWALVGLILFRHRVLPRWLVVANPVVVGIVIAVSCSLFPDSVLAASIGAATFNLAQLVFFLTTLWHFIRQHDSNAADTPA